MKISTKARYAVMAMLELAMHEKQGPLNLTEISQSQGISLSYLEQLFANLRDKGLVKGRRGPGGGYRIARDIKDGEKYPPARLWEGLSAKIEGYLSNVSLAECMEIHHDVYAHRMSNDQFHTRKSDGTLKQHS
jgi:DNA-binding IscR family transcriptional regulator